MPRIAGVDIPANKRGIISLSYIFGVGPNNAVEILEKAGIEADRKASTWTEQETATIRRIIEDEYLVEGQLRTDIQLNIKRLMDIKCYRGLRHRRGLPVRGQRTKTNARTRKGRRRTVAGKKKAPKK
jgi:small subunit ribosomal protein S13